VLRYPLAELRAAAHVNGCTIDDLLIAAVATGLRDLPNGREEYQDGLKLLASVPAEARGGSEAALIEAIAERTFDVSA
jgi:hypothetical protein